MATQPPDRDNALARAGAGSSPRGTSPIAQAAGEKDAGWRQREAVKEYLDRVWQHDKRCPICGKQDWVIDNVTEVPVRPSTPIERRGRVYPLAPILCRNCGYTFFINEKWAAS